MLNEVVFDARARGTSTQKLENEALRGNLRDQLAGDSLLPRRQS